jgi:hypothetical protein
MKKSIFHFIVLLFILNYIKVSGQSLPKEVIQEVLSSVTKQSDAQSLEKLYIHTDKPNYISGDTIWFKAYLFNAAYFTASKNSSVVYLEISNAYNQLVKRALVFVKNGLGWGNITLDSKIFPSGNYNLRAYTNWMRNFDNHYIFEKNFYISKPVETDILISSNINISKEAGKQKAHVKLSLTTVNHQPVQSEYYQLIVKQAEKSLYKNKIQSSTNGFLTFDFDLPEKLDISKLEISLQEIKQKEKSSVYQIPFIINQPENIDLQFMPEGGYLIGGIKTHVAFKALSVSGKGTNVVGAIYDSHQQKVLSFQSTHLGIGAFDFKPQSGESYTAKIDLPKLQSNIYPLPPVKTSGIVLNVVNQLESDSLEINIEYSADVQAKNYSYYLIGQSRGIACFGSVIKLQQNGKKIKINKAIFPTGIARLTLLSADKQPLNERIVYINHNDDLRLNIKKDKEIYTKRDNVSLEIIVTNKKGAPIQGSFSIAVTDNSQVKYDSLKNGSLKSNIFLTSDIKGYIEDPGYYFPIRTTIETWKDLDNLLLAQGWVDYNWKAIFQPLKTSLYPAETNFSITGNVTNVFNKPVEKAEILLLSKKPTFVADTTTDKMGVFHFKNLYPTDSVVYVLQANKKNGKNGNIEIEIEDFKPPVFNDEQNRMIPWYFNSDSSILKTVNNTIIYQSEQEKATGSRLLKEVKITAKKIINGSKNLNSDGESDLSLNQDDLQKEGKATLGELLTKYIKGFKLGYGRNTNIYYIGDKFFNLIIDGMDVDFGFPQTGSLIDYREYIKQFLDNYTAQDIKGIEVLSSTIYASVYFQHYINNIQSSPSDYAFVEVTTYSGKGPYMKKNPNILIYKPISFVSQKEFYSPKYVKKDDHIFIDSRPTVYWAPNVITNQNGMAKISFFTTDKIGSYTLLINGCDMDGGIVSTSEKMTIK